MQPMLMEARPPHISFDTIAVEDRDRSVKAGHKVYNDFVRVRIQQPGSRDTFFDEARAWLAKQEEKLIKASMDAPKPEWLEKWKAAFALYLQGREAPPDGMSIRQWPVASPAEIETLLAARVMTVEDLAALNEEGMARLGMGGRQLREKARDWLAAAEDKGQVVEKLSALEVELERTKTQNAELRQMVDELIARVEAAETKGKRTRNDQSA